MLNKVVITRSVMTTFPFAANEAVQPLFRILSKGVTRRMKCSAFGQASAGLAGSCRQFFLVREIDRGFAPQAQGNIMRTPSLKLWLAALSLAGTPVVARAQSGGPPVDVDFVFRFNVRVGDNGKQMKNAAPWYSYFPYDPRLQSQAPGSPFPHWPTQFPPSEQNTAGQNQTSRQAPQNQPTQHQPGPGLVWHANPNQTSSYPNLQLVAYPNGQAPSYWYGR